MICLHRHKAIALACILLFSHITLSDADSRYPPLQRVNHASQRSLDALDERIEPLLRREGLNTNALPLRIRTRRQEANAVKEAEVQNSSTESSNDIKEQSLQGADQKVDGTHQNTKADGSAPGAVPPQRMPEAKPDGANNPSPQEKQNGDTQGNSSEQNTDLQKEPNGAKNEQKPGDSEENHQSADDSEEDNANGEEQQQKQDTDTSPGESEDGEEPSSEDESQTLPGDDTVEPPSSPSILGGYEKLGGEFNFVLFILFVVVVVLFTYKPSRRAIFNKIFSLFSRAKKGYQHVARSEDEYALPTVHRSSTPTTTMNGSQDASWAIDMSDQFESGGGTTVTATGVIKNKQLNGARTHRANSTSAKNAAAEGGKANSKADAVEWDDWGKDDDEW
ncbi:uncharacterized protein VTP21DRAFT_635 [Calcarisporiella thermophila]|uniref:uncharacterized protein n=1 Tax=Calcarisporiella thermophila TaxID=911321 RepID=UPI0037435FDC